MRPGSTARRAPPGSGQRFMSPRTGGAGSGRQPRSSRDNLSLRPAALDLGIAVATCAVLTGSHAGLEVDFVGLGVAVVIDHAGIGTAKTRSAPGAHSKAVNSDAGDRSTGGREASCSYVLGRLSSREKPCVTPAKTARTTPAAGHARSGLSADSRPGARELDEATNRKAPLQPAVPCPRQRWPAEPAPDRPGVRPDCVSWAGSMGQL